MKIFQLFQFIFSTSEDGLWWDHDERESERKIGWGITLIFRGGSCQRHGLRPKFWLEAFKRRNERPAAKFPSAWKQFDPVYHYSYKWWFPLCPFFSVALGGYGFYIGFKPADISGREMLRPIFGDEVDNENRRALIPSITTRSTRCK